MHYLLFCFPYCWKGVDAVDEEDEPEFTTEDYQRFKLWLEEQETATQDNLK